eukprot:CAMPEP_0171980206 /NCGR_PEP_ID=MMETSP0993-20121228/260353_1 /TAXON_ID=483369 /ORGANISM="non described non described, Strain CCMP2098" /LENGTH=82 /DNA_ID=CAMNT_0012632411 /DNA_START=18 /DNA_END=266 /DNA_ORIENTATION=+
MTGLMGRALRLATSAQMECTQRRGSSVGSTAPALNACAGHRAHATGGSAFSDRSATSVSSSRCTTAVQAVQNQSPSGIRPTP